MGFNSGFKGLKFHSNFPNRVC